MYVDPTVLFFSYIAAELISPLEEAQVKTSQKCRMFSELEVPDEEITL